MTCSCPSAVHAFDCATRQSVGWIIDRDYIASPDARTEGNVGTGAYAVGVCSFGWDEHYHKNATTRFRMLDDDGNPYYGGRCTDETEFEPLDDFGAPNAGCTTIQFRNTSGEWESL